MSDLREKCGIFGIFGRGLDVSRLTYFGLYALQHRGQENSGITAAHKGKVSAWKGAGLVPQVYTEEAIAALPGHIAIGHNRYSTSGGTSVAHAQPVVVELPEAGPNAALDIRESDALLALAHNGNLPSVKALTEFLKGRGVPAEGLSDSELMAQAIAWHMDQGKTVEEALKAAWPLFTGAFSLVLMTKDKLVAARDAYGIRPLAMGRLNGGHVFASETCAFHTIGAEFVREVEPGEIVVVGEDGVKSVKMPAAPEPKFDIFELVYFARPDSELLGQSVYKVRHNFGRELAKEYRVDADIVVPVPETAFPVATGYSRDTKIGFEMCLVKNRYIHRTFIQPDQHSRDLGVKLKLTPLPEVINGKRIILIDDSIVRGTTSRQLVKAIFEAGAKEVHFLVSSPPVKFPDFYGIDMPTKEELIASEKSVEEIREFLGATSLHYLSFDGMIRATGHPAERFHAAYFTGEYVMPIGEDKGGT